jgi:hypothetical protein
MAIGAFAFVHIQFPSVVTAAETTDTLAAQFAHPPASARPWVYWFPLDGNITTSGITADLEAMQRVGIGGVLYMEVEQGTPRGPAAFAGPLWRDLFKHACSEANRLGLQVNMNNDAGWCGSGGPWITPELAMQKLVWTQATYTGPRDVDEVLTQPQAVAGFYRDIAMLAFPAPAQSSNGLPQLQEKAALAAVGHSLPAPAHFPAAPEGTTVPLDKVLDLTTSTSTPGRLQWHVPAGNWTVLRIGHTPTGKDNHPAPISGRGLECDKLSKRGSEAAFNGLMAKVISDAGPLAGKTLISTHIDSWEVGSQNWTADFREQFQRLRGYDMLRYMPVMTGQIVGSTEISERFLWDLRQTISDLLLENYAGHFHDMAKRHGLRLSIEAYNTCPCDELAYAGRADEPMGEFWSWHKFGAAFSCTEMASAAHVYGKPVVGAEAFTADSGERWLGHPGNIKDLGDWAFCEGINRFVFHRYALQPWTDRKPGMSMGPWGLHYERTQTWWEQSRAWHDYLARCQFLLQQGRPVVDICYLMPEGSPQSYNDQHIENGGHRFDLCPAELVNEMSVKNGRITFPHGMSYSVLVLPRVETMTPALLRRLAQLVRDGATVIGNPPLKSPSLSGYPECDTEVETAAMELWGSFDVPASVVARPVGAGRVFWGGGLAEATATRGKNGMFVDAKAVGRVLKENGAREDFTCAGTSGSQVLRFIHRAIGGTDAYFIANKNPREEEVQCSFRISGKRPELWWPDTGKTERVSVFAERDGCTLVPLRLGPHGSVFVVFGKAEPPKERVSSVQCDGKVVIPPEPSRVSVRVLSAMYGVLNDPKRTRDVQTKVQALVDSGTYVFPVSNMAAGDDPAFGIVKTLRVEYQADGTSYSVAATDPEEITVMPDASWKPIVEVHDDEDGFVVHASQPGRYEVRTESGKTYQARVPEMPRPTDLSGPWRVAFAVGGGAPEHIDLDSLISWSKHPDPGVKYFSGTATYTHEFDMAAEMLSKSRRLFLDLGKVEVMADVRLNGKDLGTLWKRPYRVEVTDAVRAGANVLEVRVANLWINRMIGDEQLPEDSDRNPDGTLKAWPKWLEEGKPSPSGRFTFTSWRLWKKDSPLVDSGLLGPVGISVVETAPAQ